MAADVVEELLPLIVDAFDRSVKQDARLRKVWDKVEAGTARYEDAYEYAQLISKHCSEAILKYLTVDSLPDGRLYYNIAQRIITPRLKANYDMLSPLINDIQVLINQSIGVGLNAIVDDFDTDRADRFAEYLSELDTADHALAVVASGVENFTQSVVDSSMKRNVEFQAESGIKIKVQRIAEPGCCKYCSDLAKEYDYDEIKNGGEVWSRHRGCKCTLAFNPERAGGKPKQIVWDKYSDTLGYRRNV